MRSHRFQLKKDLNMFKNLRWEETNDVTGLTVHQLYLKLPYKKDEEIIITIGQYCDSNLWYVTQEDKWAPLNFILDWTKGFRKVENCKEYVIESMIRFLKCFE